MSEPSLPSQSTSFPQTGLARHCQRLPGKNFGKKWLFPQRDADPGAAQPASQVAPADQPNATTIPIELSANDDAHL